MTITCKILPIFLLFFICTVFLNEAKINIVGRRVPLCSLYRIQDIPIAQSLRRFQIFFPYGDSEISIHVVKFHTSIIIAIREKYLMLKVVKMIDNLKIDMFITKNIVATVREISWALRYWDSRTLLTVHFQTKNFPYRTFPNEKFIVLYHTVIPVRSFPVATLHVKTRKFSRSR